MKATTAEAYKCGECDEVHRDEDRARDCCKPEVIEGYVCEDCETFHEEEADAEACCAARPSGEIVKGARCHICNAGPLRVEDVHDSAIVGAIPRCREHILSVAPELQTADSIAYGRAV